MTTDVTVPEPRSDAGGAPGGSDVSVLSDGPTADAFAERLFGSALGAIDLLSAYLGDRLGWYRSLAADGPATPRELAGRTSCDERYAREWLEQQAVSGVLSVEGADGPADQRRYALPPGPAEVLTDPASLNYLAPVARMFAAPAAQMPALLDAYRRGGGVSWDQFGDDARESQADMNRPWYEQKLAAALAAVPDIHERLARPGARVLDVGCGGGWSTIALARAYPEAVLDGVDIDEPSMSAARRNADEAGVADRVTFRAADAAGLRSDEAPAGAPYDVAFAFECVHDMAQPVTVLSAIRASLAPDGVLVVMDEAVAEEFAAPGDEIERLMYGFSLFVCLPDGRSSDPSEGTGTVMRRATLEGYARRAGFSGAEVLPTGEFGFWRFYALR
jgi:predicted O-methyltransferase YrrM